MQVSRGQPAKRRGHLIGRGDQLRQVLPLDTCVVLLAG
jgi:hypothetical protein